MRKHPYPCNRCGGESYEKPITLCTDRDNTSDSHLSWLRCPACDARYICDVVEYVSVYRDQDDVMSSGRVCEAAEWDRTLALAKRCPTPDDAKCQCAAHAARPACGEQAWYVR